MHHVGPNVHSWKLIKLMSSCIEALLLHATLWQHAAMQVTLGTSDCVLTLLHLPIFIPSHEQDKLQALRDGSWYRGGHRTVEIIDGQQRITTLLLIAAVIQYKLHELMKHMADTEPERQAARQVGWVHQFGR